MHYLVAILKGQS